MLPILPRLPRHHLCCLAMTISGMCAADPAINENALASPPWMLRTISKLRWPKLPILLVIDTKTQKICFGERDREREIQKN